MALRWGIAGTGKISHDFVTAILALQSDNHQVVAVAARTQENADEFARKYNIQQAYKGYTNLLEDSNVQVVYIGLINTQHFDIAKMMLEGGKHVLCEKPFTMNENQTRQLIELAKSRKLFIMEAIWSRCFPAYKELKHLLENGEIGKVKRIEVDLGVKLETKPIECGGSATLDLLIYCLQFQQYIFRGIEPITIKTNGTLNQAGTDDDVSAMIVYSSGASVVASASTVKMLPNVARVFGDKGTIVIPEFWAPTKIITKTGECLMFPLPSSGGSYNFPNSAGLAYEAEEVRKCILEEKRESREISHEESIQLSRWMDTITGQIRALYSSDSSGQFTPKDNILLVKSN